jgi:hypothetical protein
MPVENLSILNTPEVITPLINNVIPIVYSGITSHISLENFRNFLFTAAVFITSITTPLIIGGSAVGSNIIYKSTTGNGTTAGIAHQWVGGNNGATVIMTALNNGNVGIGTTGPGYKLHIEGNDGTNSVRAQIRNLSNSSSAFSVYQMGNDTAAVASAFFLNSSANIQYGGVNSFNMVNVLNAPLAFGTNDSIRMTITNTGNVGIGTTTPTNILSLGGQVARIFWMERNTTSNTAGNNLSVLAGGSTVGATNKNSGILDIGGQLGTGSGETRTRFWGSNGVNHGATADITPAVMFDIINNKMAFWGATAILRPIVPTGSSSDTIITALQNLGLFSQS